MTEEKKQQTLVGLLARTDTQQKRVDESYEKSLIDTPNKRSQKHTKSTQHPRPAQKKRRPTTVEMENRNTVVTIAAIEFRAKHDRLPTVGEIAAETGYSRRQIYSTTPYKEGKIAKNSSKSASNMPGGRVGEIEQYGEKSIQAPRATRRPASKQIESDPLAEQKDTETKEIGTTELIENNSYICYICGCRISPKRKTEYKCPRCGNRACSSCLEPMDFLRGVCLSCNRRANKRKAIWDIIALVCIVIIVAIVIYLLLMSLFPVGSKDLWLRPY